MSDLSPEHELAAPVAGRAEWLDAAARCSWDMRTPKSWTAAGWVYVLRQPQDRWYRNRASKIGLTYRDPAVRAKELFSTALPRPLNVAFALFAPNMAKLECDVHARLERFRADEKREVFHVELRGAIRALVETAEATGNTVGLSLVSEEAMRAAGDILRARMRPTGVWTTRYITTREETLTPAVDRLRDLAAAHVAEVRESRQRVRRGSLRAGVRWGGVAAGVAVLAAGGAALLMPATAPARLAAGACLVAAAGLGGAALGYASEWAMQVRLATSTLAERAAAVRDILEDGAHALRRKPLEIQLMRFDSRLPQDLDGAAG